MAESPQEKAKVVIDPTHPEAGKGGVVPPLHSRIQPGEVRNPGGRRKGASIVHELERRLAKGAQFDESGELVQAGTEACAIADALIGVSKGDIDPSKIDVKAALAIVERVDGAVVKERLNTNVEVRTGITLEDRREKT